MEPIFFLKKIPQGVLKPIKISDGYSTTQVLHIRSTYFGISTPWFLVDLRVVILKVYLLENYDFLSLGGFLPYGEFFAAKGFLPLGKVSLRGIIFPLGGFSSNLGNFFLHWVSFLSLMRGKVRCFP